MASSRALLARRGSVQTRALAIASGEAGCWGFGGSIRALFGGFWDVSGVLGPGLLGSLSVLRFCPPAGKGQQPASAPARTGTTDGGRASSTRGAPLQRVDWGVWAFGI